MIRPLMTLLLVFSTLFSKAQTNMTDTALKYLVYGDPKIEYLRAKDVVGKRYGFSVYAVASCVVSREIEDSADKENKRIYGIMEQRFGKYWKIKFDKEVDTMMKLQVKVKALVEKEPYIKGRWLHYIIEPVEYPNIFSVKAYGWGRLNEKDERPVHLTYFKLTANLATSTVTKESDTIELFKDPSNF